MLLAVVLVVLHGLVTIGPTKPVCDASTPCTKPAAHVVLRFTRLGHTVRVRTDAAGRYRIRLAPGTWTLRTGAGMRHTPVRVWVPRRARVRRDVAIDTGIR
jgi:hypothetical protein